MTIQFNNKKEEEELASIRRKEEETSTERHAASGNMPYADLSAMPINLEALALISEAKARAGELAAIQKNGRTIELAVANPENPAVAEATKDLEGRGFGVRLHRVSHSSLTRAWSYYEQIQARGKTIVGEILVSSSRLHEIQGEIKTIDDARSLLQEVETKRTSEILEVIIASALASHASDIHLEPQADQTRIRYRLDGVLNDLGALSPEGYKPLVGRIKLVSQMKLNIQTTGQDGRFTIKTEDGEIEVRASALPGPYGENIVLRILDPKSIGVKFTELGMQPWVEEAMAKELKKPNGMILTTGPTGSGKTTTLYEFLKEVHTPGIKIITLEDPIEYHITGIEQTQVHPESGYDFAAGLRSIVRQDPDVILVGEIRDKETAETAMHASLTGHLVFSTLHTNDAAGTIPRLIDLGVDPAIIAPAMNVAMAQRLVRRLCEACKKRRDATPEERAMIENELKSFPKNVPVPALQTPVTLYTTQGCPECHNTGYRGRIGVFEIILVDEEVERLIMKKPSEGEVKEAARRQNQITMREDGLLKVVAGLTDLAELNRVVGEK